jgi:hypothetical protein
MRITLNGISPIYPTPPELAARAGDLSFPLTHESWGNLPQSARLWYPEDPAVDRVVSPVLSLGHWTRGHLCFLDADLTLLEATSGYPACTLELDGVGVAKVEVVDRRPVSDTREALSVTEGDARNAYVLTVTDARYRLASVLHDGTNDDATTFETLLTGLLGRMGLSLLSYPASVTAPAESAAGYWAGSRIVGLPVAAVFDSVVATLGLRAVWDATGAAGVRVQGASEAQTAADAMDVSARGHGGLAWAFDAPGALKVALYAPGFAVGSVVTAGSGTDYASASLPDGSGWGAYLLGEYTDWGANTAYVGTLVGAQPFPGTANNSWVGWGGDETRLYAGDRLRNLMPDSPPGGGSPLLTSETDTEAATEMSVDDNKPTPVMRYLRRDFVEKRGAADADPKTLAIRYSKSITYVADICVVKNGSGYVTDVIKVFQTVTLPGGVTIGETTCVTAGSGCCPASTWWCTGPDGSPAWTVVEVVPGGTPPTGAIGPYSSSAAAALACHNPPPPDGGEPCGEAFVNSIPATLYLTIPAGGWSCGLTAGSYVMPASGSWPLRGWYSGNIPSCDTAGCDSTNQAQLNCQDGNLVLHFATSFGAVTGVLIASNASPFSQTWRISRTYFDRFGVGTVDVTVTE